MNKIISTIIALSIAIVSFPQKSLKTSVDFATDSCLKKFRPDTIGRIRFVFNCKPKNTGYADGYMIHKNGGSWWYKEAKRRFPNDVMNCEYKLAKKLLSEDKDSLKNYSKWIFYIDIKFLEPVVQVHGETGVEETAYYPIEGKHLDVIVFERLAGETIWVEVEKKIFETDAKYYKSTWKGDFINKKLKESNSIK